MPHLEDRIRDELSTRLDLIEDGLSLIDTDYALPNSEGTRGRIDILARDRHGVLVVIELKRSNNTAREALHEVMKYTELMQRERGVQSYNIRASIISTHWDELRVPFSHFKRGWTNEIRGYSLRLDQDLVTPIKVAEVPPLASMPMRGTSPIQLVVFPRRDIDISQIWDESTKRLAEVGADDLLGVEYMHARDGRSLLYLVIGVMTPDDPRTAALDEFADDVPDDAISVPYGYVLEYRALCYLTSGYDYDRVEIETAYPEKYGALRDDQNWTMQRVRRSGIFAYQSDLYSDEVLLGRIYDDGGHSQIKFKGSSRPSNRGHYAEFRRNLARCVDDVEGWSEGFSIWLDEVAARTPDRDIVSQAYCPSDFVGSLVHGWPNQLEFYLPSLQAYVDAPPPDSRILRGTLAWNGGSVNISNVFHSVYRDPFDWVVENHLSVPWLQDLELLTGLGLNYSLFEWSTEYDNVVLLELSDGTLRRIPPQSLADDGVPQWQSIKPLPDFFDNYASEINSIVAEYKSVIYKNTGP